MKLFCVSTNRPIFSKRLRRLMLGVSVLMFPLGAWTQEVPYLEFDTGTRTFSEKTVTIDGENVIALTSSKTSLEGGKTYVVNSNIDFNGHLYIYGTSPVKLILCDDKTLTVSRGIQVETNQTLEIYAQEGGTGALASSGWCYEDPAGDSYYYAPLGGSYEVPQGGGGWSNGCGTIKIHGGQITADASDDPVSNSSISSAGIGGCKDDGGTVEIYGGTIIAKGSRECAGIGSASGGSNFSVTIYGGTVNATGGDRGAGIGGGEYGRCGEVTIYGGTVIANGGASGAGIGRGYKGDYLSSNASEKLTIYDGYVEATGGAYGAGIGGGYQSTGCEVEICGGTVIAKGGTYGAGIGGGSSGNGGDVTIKGGKVTATGDAGDTNGIYGIAHGIGAGSPAKGDNLIDKTLKLGIYTICYGGDSENPTGNAVEGPVNDVTTRYRFMTTEIMIPWAGSGTSDAPYLVSTPEQLKAVATYVNNDIINGVYFQLANDIDCSELTDFEPIGYNASFFLGTFDGYNFTISNLNKNQNCNDAFCLFGIIGYNENTPGIVKNLNLDNCKFRGTHGDNTGSIAIMLCSGSKIENCTVTSCEISGSDTMYGGIVAYTQYKTTVQDCSVENSTISFATDGITTDAIIGGIVAYMEGGCDVKNCIVDNVQITTSESTGTIGGIAGMSGGSIQSCTVKNGTAITCGFDSNAGNSSFAGAIVGVATLDCDLNDNYYYYDVSIEINDVSSAEKEEESGYTQRGVGSDDNQNYNFDIFTENGAVLYTKLLTLPDEDAYGSVAGVDGTYYKKADENNGIYVAPGQTAQVLITPNGDYVPSAVSVTYSDGSSEENITKANNSYTYSFEMDDFDATFNAIFVYNTKYALWINGTQVTEGNRNDILGDAVQGQRPASFIYNPNNNNLIVSASKDNTDYNIESEIDQGLTIYLAPKKEILLNSITYTGKMNVPLTITTDGNNPGRLTLENNNPVSVTPVISGFSQLILDEKRNLAIISPEGIDYQDKQLDTKAATIGVPMNPITKDKSIVPDGNRIVPEGGDSDINKVVDDILYTLGDTEDPEGDGFDDGGFVVINTVTSDQEAAEAAKEYTPGTDEFMEHLKGMTFMVPAGNGKIRLDVQTMNAHILKVKIGDAFPYSVEKTERGEIEIPYNVGKPTYVYLYNSGPAAAKARSKAISKGGKKKVTNIRVYKIGSNPSNVKSSNPVGNASGGAYTGDTSDLEGQEVMSYEDIVAGMGDVDGDGRQTAKDITEMVKAIMGMHTGAYDDTYADMDGDGVITISDIIQVVNKIMKQ